jgi:hypothetical protein
VLRLKGIIICFTGSSSKNWLNSRTSPKPLPRTSLFSLNIKNPFEQWAWLEECPLPSAPSSSKTQPTLHNVPQTEQGNAGLYRLLKLMGPPTMLTAFSPSNSKPFERVAHLDRGPPGRAQRKGPTGGWVERARTGGGSRVRIRKKNQAHRGFGDVRRCLRASRFLCTSAQFQRCRF